MKNAILIILVLTAVNALGQQARVTRYTTPLAGTVIFKDVEDKYSPQVFSLESPAPDGNFDKMMLRDIKKEIAEKYPHKRMVRSNAKSTQAALPVVLNGFVADSFSGIPPDNDMAISNGLKAVSVVNSNIAILNPSLGVQTQRKSLNTFALAAGLPYSSFNSPYNYKYDPKVIYDPEADRFIAVILNGVDQFNWVIFGFSQTNDPAGTWNFYKVVGDYASDSTWFDYPTIAFTHDEFFLSGNKLIYDGSWQTGFRQSVIYQVRKADGYTGSSTLNYQLWDSLSTNSGVYIRNIYPVKGGGSIHGPEQYFVSKRNLDIQNDTVLLMKIPDTIGSMNNNFSVTILQSNLPYGVPPDGRQDTTNDPTIGTLATNDGRILGAFIENNEIQFVSASLNPGTGSSGIYHGRISNVSTTPTVSANMFAIDTIDFGYPNISYTGGNTAIISANYTGPKTYAGLGAIYFDGSQYSDLLKVKEGANVIDVMTGQQRWGDYMGSQPFWSMIGRVWIEGIFGRQDKMYGSYMAEIGNPGLAGVREEKKTLPAGSVYPNPAFEVIQAEFTMNIAELVDFALYDMQGRMVDKLYSATCKKGKNMLQFNIASLPAGNYILKGVNTKGATIMTNKFTRQ